MRFWHGLLVACLMIGAPTPAEAALIITVYESGNNVLATATGSLNLTGLARGTSTSTSGVTPDRGTLTLGVSGPVYGYLGASGPISLGPVGTTSFPTSVAGIQVGLGIVIAGQRLILVDQSYTFGSPINSTAQWNNATITSLGLTPGQYVYTWSNDSLTVTITPEPSSLGLMAFGGLALLYRLRKCS
jgi:hypothetical protein